MGIILTIIIGLFFLVGIIIVNHIKDKERMSLFTISLALIVMLGLLIFDLLQEIIDAHNILLIIPIILGFTILIILDKLIPHHNHEHHDNEENKLEHNLHLNHIGTITVIAIAIHNLLEGLTLYNLALSNISSSILMMISIALHNIPLGFQIGNSLMEKKYSKLLIFFLCISSFLGALIIIIFGSLSTNVTNILLSLTFGMLIYILIFELFREIVTSLKKKEVIYGIILGVIVLIITYLI